MAERVEGLGTAYGGPASWGGGAWTQRGCFVHFAGLGQGQGNREDIEKGAVEMWELLYRVTGGEGTKTTIPNHADKTACAAQQSRGPGGSPSPEAAAPRPPRWGGPGVPISATHCWWHRADDPPLQSQRK